MKTSIGALVLLGPLTLAGAGGALAAEACSEATLHGTYLFAHDGFRVTANGRHPFAIAGQDVYDGHGHQRGIITVSENGRITKLIRDTGVYTIRPNCIGSVRFSGGTTANLFIAPDGSQIAFIETNPGSVRAGPEQRVSTSLTGD